MKGGGRFMKKSNDVKVVIILFSLFILFTLPCVSFATIFSDIQLGNEDNTIKIYIAMVLVAVLHGPSMVVREQTEYGHGGCNPKPAPAPVSSAVWLLGYGLVGLIGINENCKNRLSSTADTDLQHQVFNIGHHKNF
jgi:hypothetical protein